jgi:hypothetical protein
VIFYCRCETEGAFPASIAAMSDNLFQEEDIMTRDTLLESAQADEGLWAGAASASVVETGEVEIAGHRYVTADRLAGILGVTVRTLARWNAARIGPPKISIGKTVLFDVAKLPDWLATRETHPTRKTRH